MVRRVRRRDARTAVCNLTVGGLHTFAVGTAQALVHNTSGTLPYDPLQVPGPNPNNLRMRVVAEPTDGQGVYLKPHQGKTKVGSTGGTKTFRTRYNLKDGDKIEVEIDQTRFRKPDGVDDSEYTWSDARQRRFDEEYVDRVTPPGIRYRAKDKPQPPVSQEKWEKYRHIFGYGDLPPDFGY
ncbi:MAG: AbrB/MazE/SpoVT family DNA-binding domain-containing protein [Gemmataceae bacterium]|nr:AbrB/MazE/SpoVT family DNA-binding domain-containing protein [Gemmataceae bacterium]